jgi:hypothetical protein
MNTTDLSWEQLMAVLASEGLLDACDEMQVADDYADDELNDPRYAEEFVVQIEI